MKKSKPLDPKLFTNIPATSYQGACGRTLGGPPASAQKTEEPLKVDPKFKAQGSEA